MTGPPCGELSRYLDEVRKRRKAAEAEAKKAAEMDAFMGMCMAMPSEITLDELNAELKRLEFWGR